MPLHMYIDISTEPVLFAMMRTFLYLAYIPTRLDGFNLSQDSGFVKSFFQKGGKCGL